MKEIEVGKKYTFDGYLGIIRYTDGKEPKYPVLWKDLGTGATYHFSIKGYWRGDDKTKLIELNKQDIFHEKVICVEFTV